MGKSTSKRLVEPLKDVDKLLNVGVYSQQVKYGETILDNIEKGLAKLAAGLEPEQRKTEQGLRKEFMAAERLMFSSRLERGKALAGYRALYAPLNKLSAFLRIIRVDRATAYRLIDAAEIAALGAKKPSKSKHAGLAKTSEIDAIVEEVVSFARETVREGLSDATQRKMAFNAIATKLTGIEHVNVVVTDEKVTDIVEHAPKPASSEKFRRAA